MDEALRERLKAIFADHYGREQFKLSMGERGAAASGVSVLAGFLAQGIAHLAYYDEKYLATLIDTHGKTCKLVEALKALGETNSPQYHYPLILGVIIEDALQAVNKLRKEDRADEQG